MAPVVASEVQSGKAVLTRKPVLYIRAPASITAAVAASAALAQLFVDVGVGATLARPKAGTKLWSGEVVHSKVVGP